MRELNLAATGPNLEMDGERGSLVAILWRGRFLIVACVVASLALTGAYLACAGRVYEATARLLILQPGGRPLTIGGGAAVRLGDRAEGMVPTQALVLRSPVVVERAIRAVGLEALPSLASAGGGTDRAVQDATKNLSVLRPDRAADVLQIDYRAGSPEEAKRMVAAVAASYEDFLREVYRENNGAVVALITKARDELDAELKGLEAKYLEFRGAHPMLGGDEPGRPLIGRRVGEWDRAANEVMVKAVRLKAQLALGRRLASEGTALWAIVQAMEQVGGPSGVAMKAEPMGPAPASDYLRQLAQEQQQVADRLGPRSTRVKEIQEQIEQVQGRSRDVRRQLERGETRDLLAALETSLETIEGMRTELSGRLEGDMKQARQAEIDLQTDANLRGDLERQRALFNTVVDQLRQAQFGGDLGEIRSEVVEAPNVQPRPIRPLVSLTLALALAVGLVSGVGAAVATDRFDARLRSADEVRRALRLPLLGQVPRLPELQARRVGHAGLVSHALPRSPTAEAYRVVRTNLDLARRNRQVRVVLVTSPRGQDGKSTAASNLAISLAQAGRRVLLVDADLRSPRQHEIHGVEREPGLVQVLRDGLPLGRVAQPSGVPHLEIVASGPEVANPAELLDAPQLAEFLESAGALYDVVLLDAPAILAIADASILGSIVDGVVLVVRASATRRDDAERAAEVLESLGAPVLGVLVNGVPNDHGAWAATGVMRVDRPLAELRPDPQLTFPADFTRVVPWSVTPGDDRPTLQLTDSEATRHD